VEERSIDLVATVNRFPRIAEIPFSSERKKMTVVLRDSVQGGHLVLTKGALDQLPFKNKWTEELVQARKVHDEFAGNALRVIALAGKRVRELPDVTAPETVESDVDLIGLVGLIDPPRLDAAQAIAKAEGAGIRTVMITGDHAATATAIAKEMGILHHGQNVMTGAELAAMSDVELNDTIRNFPVFARVTPEDKIRIVRAWQANGEVVAMTGDGVNDAPALRVADVGIAMGDTGTEVAKDAADIVLTDDNFATIVEAVSEGRNVYHIVVKVVYFLLVCNLSEIIIMVTGQMMAWGLVMTPAMLLTINLLGDGIPGLNLAREKSDPNLMAGPPNKSDASFLSGGLLVLIVRQAVACTVVVLIAFHLGADRVVTQGIIPSPLVGQTMAFLVCGWTSILHIFNVRSSKSIFATPIRDNVPLVICAWAMVGLFAILVATPAGLILGLVPIGLNHWFFAICLSLVPTAVREVFTRQPRRRRRHRDVIFRATATAIPQN
ncbi:MAG: cation-translocating P-type ATPase, partial [Promicromonosporaceae bacterium]|nr:cation-translocating P-type ATPase [Promicromonosporaceae bacterium]